MMCLLCGSNSNTGRFELDNGFTLLQCDACQLQYVHPRPTLEQLKAVYDPPPAGTFGDHNAEQTRELGLVYDALISASRPTGRTVLEVGCNTGFLLHGLKQIGYNVIGSDLSETAIRYAKEQYGLEQIYLAEFPPDELAAAVDVLIASHIIEHVLDPKSFVRHCARFLKPGGICILRTPNVLSAGIRAFKGHYPVFCPPVHLNYFSIATLSLLFSEEFEVIQAKTHTDSSDPRNFVFNSLVATSHILGFKKRLKKAPVLSMESGGGSGTYNAMPLVQNATRFVQTAATPLVLALDKIGMGENILFVSRKKPARA